MPTSAETYIVGVDLTGAIGLDAPKVAITESTSTLYVRITEQPLTARNLATATSALTQLHTQCWLIATDQFAELIEYTQTHNPSFDEEANLTIAEMTHHSPAEIIFNVSLEGVANALKTAIDAVTGMWERKRELELKNDALEEEIRQKKQEAEVTLASEEIAQQKALVELYDMQIEVRRKQLDLLDYATEKAPKFSSRYAQTPTRPPKLWQLIPSSKASHSLGRPKDSNFYHHYPIANHHRKRVKRKQ